MKDKTAKSVDKSALAMVLAVAMGTGANAETWVYGDLTNELQVAASETYTLTEEDATTLGGKCLYLTGEGTVVGNEAFTNFTGNIRISNGMFRYETHGGLGVEDSTVRELKIDGTGTLHNKVGAPTTWSSTGGFPSIPLNMKLYLEGDGYQGQGAIFNESECQNLARQIELTGDTTLNGGRVQFRYAILTMNGHSIKVLPKTNLGMVELGGCDDPAGDISLDQARLFLSDATFPMTDAVWKIKDSTIQCYNWGTPNRKANYATIEFAGASALEATIGKPYLNQYMTNDSADRNRFQGNVRLNGDVKLLFNGNTGNTGIAFDGVASGEKGFVWSSGSGYLLLSNTNNTFAGGVSIAGTKASDTEFKGGLALLGNGALPANGGAVKLQNAMLILNASTIWDTANKQVDTISRYDLPPIMVEDGGIISNSNKLDQVSAKSLVKNGAGTLSLLPSMSFEGLAEVNGGTLKLAEVARANSGLYWWWKQASSYDLDEETCLGVDEKLTYAYSGWPYGGSGANGDPSYAQRFVYQGYMRIPGEEGTDVKFNFLTSIARVCVIKIDGTTVASFNDNSSDLAGTVKVGNWTRFAIAPAFTMKAGWHKVTIAMRNGWDASRGPWGQKVNVGTDEDGNAIYATWPANFGIGVDWEGRCTTNSANYVKLQDPGDGSLFRRDAVGSSQSTFFHGGVAFAAGTVFDVNHASDSAFELPLLIGSPSIVNGAVHVAEPVWRLRQGDIAPEKPLTVTESASLSFGDDHPDVEVNVDADADAALRASGLSSIKILAWANESVKPANRFITGETTRAIHWGVKECADGVYLVDRNGLRLIIR
ncbi:MAG: hypothetical protein ACI4RD_03260 [Kiritimatiellia bacterium]